MAKFGIALGSGPRGHGFESRHSDHIKSLETVIYQRIRAFSHFWKSPTKRKCQQKVSTNSKKFRCVLLFLCSLDNIITINRRIFNRWIVNRWIFVMRLNAYPVYVWLYTRIAFECTTPCKVFALPLANAQRRELQGVVKKVYRWWKKFTGVYGQTRYGYAVKRIRGMRSNA